LDSFDSHFLLLGGTVQVFEKFPIFGGGVGSFFEHFKTTPLADEFLKRDPAGLNVKVPAHTIWGEVLSETGIFGFFVFVVLILFVLSSQLFSVIHASKDNLLLRSAFLSNSLGWLVAGIFYSYNSEFFFLCFFIPVIYLLKTDTLNFNKLYDYFSKKPIYGVSIIFLLLVFTLFYKLGSNRFIPFDEAIYAKVAKNIYESGDFLTLTWLDNKQWFEKPPLIFWLMTISVHIFEVNEFAFRIPSVLAGLVTIIFTYKLTKLISSSSSGVIAMIALGTNITFMYYSRLAMIDVLLTMFILLSVYYFVLSETKPKKIYLLLSGAFIGCAVMTKSVVGLLPLIFYFTYYSFVLSKKITDLKIIKRYSFNFSIIFMTSLVVFLPWHLTMFLMYGDSFINSYLGYHVFSRFSTEIEDKGAPWNFYLDVIKMSMRAYYVVLLPALVYFSYLLWKKKISAVYFLILNITGLILLFFSISSSKLLWYIMPIFPFLSLICGVFISDLGNAIFKITKSNLYRFLFFMLVIFLSFYYFFTVRERVYVGDMTGREVEMIISNNNRAFDPEEKFFADNVHLPLLQFYSNRKVEQVSYSDLKNRILDAYKENRPLVFITKESRFETIFKTVTPHVKLLNKNEDYALGEVDLK
jgi:hypothetical protein